MEIGSLGLGTGEKRYAGFKFCSRGYIMYRLGMEISILGYIGKEVYGV